MTVQTAIDANTAHTVDAAKVTEMPLMPVQAALPAPAQFASVVDLIKTVFSVPAVSIALHGAPANAEGGVYRSFLEIPLVRDDDVIGSLRILDNAERSFTDHDCTLLEGFARLVVEQVELWAEASRDLLTGAMTRRAFLDALRKTFAVHNRTHVKTALVMFDLDHFKTINDTYGHAAGDAVLRAVARTVLRELRVEDSFGRIGGEEFAILLANADATIAAEVSERVRTAIERMTVPDFNHIRVTSSFGVAEATDDVLDVEDWTERADAELYRAKASGRNRVCVPQPTVTLKAAVN